MREQGASRGSGWERYDAKVRELEPETVAREFLGEVELPREARAFDFGAGQGVLISGLKALYPDISVDAFEVREDARAGLLENGADAVIIGETPPPAMQAYDAVFARHSLYFIDRAKLPGTVRGLADSLKNGGKMVITLFAQEPGWEGSRFAAFTREQVTSLLDGVGVEVDRIETRSESFGTQNPRNRSYYQIVGTKRPS